MTSWQHPMIETSVRTMLTDSDRKYINDEVGRAGAIRQSMLFISILFFLFFGMVKFYMATLWCGLAGHSFPAFVVRWLAGTSANHTYSGRFVMAADDLTFSLLYIGLAAMFAILWWTGRRSRERTQRIANALKSSGENGL